MIERFLYWFAQTDFGYRLLLHNESYQTLLYENDWLWKTNERLSERLASALETRACC